MNARKTAGKDIVAIPLGGKSTATDKVVNDPFSNLSVSPHLVLFAQSEPGFLCCWEIFGSGL